MSENIYLKQDRIKSLKGRMERCRCKFCGSPLELRRIVFSDYEDARIELFCPECDRIEYGVEPEIYQSAKYFVDTFQFNHFPELSQNEQTHKMNIAKVCDIMSWVCKNLGFAGEDGFVVPVNMQKALLGETLVLSESELNRLS